MKNYQTPNFKKAKESLDGTRKCIVASGMSRTVGHMLNSGSWGIISAHDTQANIKHIKDEEAGKYPEINVARTNTLKQSLRDNGFGFIAVDGGWVDQDSGLKDYIKEQSFLIPGISEELLKKLSDVYNQYGYIFGENGSYRLMGRDKTQNPETSQVEWSNFVPWQTGLVTDDFAQWTEDASPYGYSETKGRRWILNQPSETQEEEMSETLDGETQKVASIHIKRDYGTVFFQTKPWRYMSGRYGLKQASEVQPTSLLTIYLPVYNKTKRKK